MSSSSIETPIIEVNETQNNGRQNVHDSNAARGTGRHSLPNYHWQNLNEDILNRIAYGTDEPVFYDMHLENEGEL